MERYSQALSLSLSLSLSLDRKHLCRFSSRQFRQKIHRPFGFLALLVSPCYLYLPVTPRFSFLRPLRPRFACPPLSYRHFFEMPSPHLPPPSAENGSTIFHKMSGNKNSGEEGERRGQQRRRVEIIFKRRGSNALPSSLSSSRGRGI